MYTCTLDARPLRWHHHNLLLTSKSPHLVFRHSPPLDTPLTLWCHGDNLHRDNFYTRAHGDLVRDDLLCAPPCSQYWYVHIYGAHYYLGWEAGLRNALCVPIIMLDSLLQWFIFTQTQHNWVWALNPPRETCNWLVTSSRADTLKCSPRTNWASSPLSVSVSLSPMSVLSRSVSLLSQP